MSFDRNAELAAVFKERVRRLEQHAARISDLRKSVAHDRAH